MPITLKQGIIDTARALGMNPLVLATIISYETGGTFNPSQAGPRTRYGQHRGLIQFGEPQAKQYGVDWANALESQLGNGGQNAVYRYFTRSGYRPGMGLLDAYSIVNAGGPGKYRAMDLGTSVSQKVYSDAMRKHGEKAAALMGGEYSPDIADSFNAYNEQAAADATAAPEEQPFKLTEGPKYEQPKLVGDDDLGNTFAKSVVANDHSLEAGGGMEGGDTPGIGPLDYATVAKETPFTPSPGGDLSPLAQLFSLKNIGQAPAMQAANPRRFYA